MEYILVTFLAGVFSGCISVGFRFYEIANEKILVGTQFFDQVIVFGIWSFVFWKMYSEYFLEIGILKLNWFFLFFLISSLSYYVVQVVFEKVIRISLFPTEEEIEAYIERNIQ